MPFADFCCTFKKNHFCSSRVSTTCSRPPVVSSTAFSAPPPDLPTLALMDMGFAAHCQLARECWPRIRFLSIGTRHCSTLPRSEEHTSELQSPYDLVCRLLLEKKKKKTRQPYHKQKTKKTQHN